jgi:hypothetical protein
VEALNLSSLAPANRSDLAAFQRKVASLQRAVLGAIEVTRQTRERLDHVRKALDDTPGAEPKLSADARAIAKRLAAIRVSLSGDDVLQSHNEPAPLAIADRVGAIVTAQWTSTSPATATSQAAYEIAAEAFAATLEQLRALVDGDLRALEAAMEAAGAPWTPGRLPQWRR